MNSVLDYTEIIPSAQVIKICPAECETLLQLLDLYDISNVGFALCFTEYSESNQEYDSYFIERDLDENLSEEQVILIFNEIADAYEKLQEAFSKATIVDNTHLQLTVEPELSTPVNEDDPFGGVRWLVLGVCEYTPAGKWLKYQMETQRETDNSGV